MKLLIVLMVVLFIFCSFLIEKADTVADNVDIVDKYENTIDDCSLYNKVPDTIVIQLYQIIKDFHEIAENNGLSYWITGGTLIGAIRHSGFISWDDDIDIGIEEKDLELFLSLKKQLEQIGYQVVEFPLFGYKIFGQGEKTWIDVFLFKQEKDKFILAYEEARNTWPQEFFSLVSINEKQLYKFGEIYLLGPSRAIPYLNRSYKDWHINGHYWGGHGSNCNAITWKLSEEDFEPAKPFR